MAGLEELLKKEEKKVKEENSWDDAGEGMAMGLMALGDAFGGAWGGKTDYLGSYVKMKKAAKKSKLTPYQALQLIRQKKAATYKKGRDIKTDAAGKAKDEREQDLKIINVIRNWKITNAKLAEQNLPTQPLPTELKPYIAGWKKGKTTSQIRKGIESVVPPQISSRTGTYPPRTPLRKKPIEIQTPKRPKKIIEVEKERTTETIQVEPKGKEFTNKYFLGKSGRGLESDSATVSNITGIETRLRTKADKDNAKNTITRGTNARNRADTILKESRKGSKFSSSYIPLRAKLNKALFSSIFDQLGGIEQDFDFSKNILSEGGKIFYVRESPDGSTYKKEFKLPGNWGFISSLATPRMRGFYSSKIAGKDIGEDEFSSVWRGLKGLKLNELSGAAVSKDEYERFLEGLENAGRDPALVILALQDMDNSVRGSYSRVWNDALRGVKDQNKGYYNTLLNDRYHPNQLFTGYSDTSDPKFYRNIHNLIDKRKDRSIDMYVPDGKRNFQITREEFKKVFEGEKDPRKKRQLWKDWIWETRKNRGTRK